MPRHIITSKLAQSNYAGDRVSNQGQELSGQGARFIDLTDNNKSTKNIILPDTVLPEISPTPPPKKPTSRSAIPIPKQAAPEDSKPLEEIVKTEEEAKEEQAETATTVADTPVKAPTQSDKYTDKLIKLIPIESISVYAALNGVLPELNVTPIWDFLVLLLVIIGNLAYMRNADAQIGLKQLSIHTLALILWVYTLGGPFERSFVNYNPLLGSVLVPLFVFLVPLINTDWFRPRVDNVNTVTT